MNRRGCKGTTRGRVGDANERYCRLCRNSLGSVVITTVCTVKSVILSQDVGRIEVQRCPFNGEQCDGVLLQPQGDHGLGNHVHRSSSNVERTYDPMLVFVVMSKECVML